MLILSSDIADAILRHARDTHPIECCGIVAGTPGDAAPSRVIPMHNAAQSATFFRFDAAEQLRVWRDLAARDESPSVIYHSHTASAARPSLTDIAYAAAYPDAYHLIVSTDPRYTPVLRCYRIVDGTVSEVAIHIDG
ncbi:M67 family metallopeptidase [Burkholderia multivorans]|uniref:Mov34/MPN/PAD-1 family protein n=1 Tax=Burkholderia multivorans TaxID=87883 RepID=UPI0009E0D3D0|nr:M67 family metallopeptidase [Burkholderia multivorans]MCA8500843.1 M67 family metallopeptidase [Burkholderia multivorans]MDN8002729.1 M67 family metallopeptidase [Burkholderia multivorans]MDN8079825.1 M67 family metallopeptidase [Burkholderia multivorans]PRF31610.1 peptidase [Burkholderia multivorans]PRH04382.1 peptidase [Burkholderia multivorans]